MMNHIEHLATTAAELQALLEGLKRFGLSPHCTIEDNDLIQGVLRGTTELLAENARLAAERDAAKQEPWPSWAQRIYDMLREYGMQYDGDEIDLGDAVAEWLSDFDPVDQDEARALRAALAAIQTEAERENGGWVHLKRTIAAQAKKALSGGGA